MKTTVLLLTAFLIAMPCFAVQSTSRHDSAEQELVDAIWRYHVATIRSAMTQQHQGSLDEFAASIDFVESLTGLGSDTLTWAGRIPTAELPGAVARWEKWFTQNRTALIVVRDRCGGLTLKKR
jgi:hypothetical protein